MRGTCRLLLLSLGLALLGALFLGGARQALRWIYPYPEELRPLIEREAERHGLDPLLIASLIRVESRFDPRARSHRNAHGLMQLVPATATDVARRLGRGGPVTPEELYDPALNVELGTWYLADLLREFDGDLPLAVAAYNAGRGNVARWRAQGVWNGDLEGLQRLPYAETRRFVQSVLDGQRVYEWLYRSDPLP